MMARSAARQPGSRTPRAGTSLVELLAALPIAMLVATTAALLLVHVARVARAQSSALSVARELRHAVRVLSAELEPLRGSALRIVSDTLLQFTGQLGVLITCATPTPRTLLAAVPHASSDHWLHSLKSGDVLRIWHTGSPSDAPNARERELDAPPVALGGGQCGADSATASGARWRFTLADSSLAVAIGAPITAHRDVRYRYYRSGNSWWLGRQQWDGTGWETVQPVAGPLRAPSAAVMQMRALDRFGNAVPITIGTADSIRDIVASLRITLGMSRRTTQQGRREHDTVTFSIPLRADAYRRR